ncbi:hypothetical protein [Nocardioides sp.]|uniref:hypothetical protein n=1 Tax=Nocardioides sp. TaxID=35761 RepID=UPI002612DF33|nr:hypothetical protein [Nocardioides sp.]MDI6909557.1 hypothetical protein [Nocardioides sp.]
MFRTPRPVVPLDLQRQVTDALAAVARAETRLARVPLGAPLVARRPAHAALTRAFDAADAVLRQATTIAKQHSRHEWALWRHRLSRLDTARQIHLLAETDDPSVLRLGTVRAIDTGMSGPDYGDLLHGESCEPGTPARYGLDLEAVLATDGVAAEPAAAPAVLHRTLRGAVPPAPSYPRAHAPARPGQLPRDRAGAC